MKAPLRLLLLGGTTEAAALADRLSENAAIQTISSLAGRVVNPVLPKGDVRIGGFGGVNGLTHYLERERIDVLIDATHPYAAKMSINAQIACDRLDLPRMTVVRPVWSAVPGDQWLEAEDIGAAARTAAAIAERIFVTVGRQELAPFAAYTDPWFLIRTIDRPTEPLPVNHELLLQRGPFSKEAELELLHNRRIDLIVSKNSGGQATYAKIEAARELDIPVVMVRRPRKPAGVTVHCVDDALVWIASVS